MSSAEIMALRAEVEMLKSALSSSMKVGPVEVIDPVKGYRLKLGEDADGEPFLSPWHPHPETGKTSVPLKKGQIVGVMNPVGNQRQGVIFRAGYSDENASPNQDMKANVFDDAGVRMTIAGGELATKSRTIRHETEGDIDIVSGGIVRFS